MKVVIEIDKDYYEILKHDVDKGMDYLPCVLIAKGTPLPKGHGRLIDVNDLLDVLNLEDNDYNRDINTGEIITLENIDRIPTIIEADKEIQNES